MHSRLLVSDLPRSLPSLPHSPAPPCLPCIEGRQRAAPHPSSFPPTTAPLQNLHMDMWGPTPVSGIYQERYFLLVVDDYKRYTTVFPLRRKADVSGVLIPWIRATRHQLRERFWRDLPVRRLHSDRGGEFSSGFLEEFCRDEGIRQTFTLPASPQQNGIVERRNGLIMEVAHTFMIHAAAPHFLWPFAVRYAAHQLNLWLRVSEPETSPILRWTGKVGDASVFRVWGALSLVRDAKASKLSSRTLRCVFLGFPTDAPPWQLYHPCARRVFSSHDVTFDESLCFYRLHPHASHPVPLAPLFLVPVLPPVDPFAPQGLAPLGVSQVDPPPFVEPLEISSDSSGEAEGGDPTADDTAATWRSPRLETPPGFPPRPSSPPPQPAAMDSGAETASAEPRSAETESAGSGGAATGGATTGVPASGGTDSGSTASRSGGGAVGDHAGGPGAGQPLQPDILETLLLQAICAWIVRRGSPGGGGFGPVGDGATSPGGTGGGAGGSDGAAGAGGARATSPGGATGAGAAGAAGTGGASAAGVGGAGGAARAGGAGVASAGGVAGAGGAGAATPGGAAGAGGAGGARATSAGGAAGAGGAGAATTGGIARGARGTTSAGGAGASSARGAGPAGALRHLLGLLPAPTEFPVAGTTPPLLFPQLLPRSPLPALAPYTAVTESLTEHREPETRASTPERREPETRASVSACVRRVRRPRAPAVPGTHDMTLHPSLVPQRVVLPSPDASSIPDIADPPSDLARASSPTVTRVLATVVTDPTFSYPAVSALVTELVEFSAAHRLDYLASLVSDPDPACPPSIGGEVALGCDVLEDRHEELECLAAAAPHLATMLLASEGDPDALDIPTPRSYREVISDTYVDEVPPPGVNIVSGMCIFRVKWPPGSPPAFKARYVARGFSQREGVDFFQTFSPTPKMTTLRVSLHVAAQCDYELHSLDFSATYLQGSLHEAIWLRRPLGFTGSFHEGTQWSLRRPVYNLRQAPREWHDTLRKTLTALGFAPSTTDPSLFPRNDTTLPPFYVLVYVDDLVFATADPEAMALVKAELQEGHTCTDLGPQALWLPVLLATAHSCVYRSLALSSTFGRGPTSGMGLVLGGWGSVVLTGHSDASWADDQATQRSSQAYTFSLCSGSVSWRSTRSSSVLGSSCEAEIYAGAMAAHELRSLTYLLTDLGEQPHSPPFLYVYNKAMRALCREQRLEHRTKHIALCYFLARELQQRGQLRLAYVAFRADTADVFTKALGPGDHQLSRLARWCAGQRGALGSWAHWRAGQRGTLARWAAGHAGALSTGARWRYEQQGVRAAHGQRAGRAGQQRDGVLSRAEMTGRAGKWTAGQSRRNRLPPARCPAPCTSVARACPAAHPCCCCNCRPHAALHRALLALPVPALLHTHSAAAAAARTLPCSLPCLRYCAAAAACITLTEPLPTSLPCPHERISPCPAHTSAFHLALPTRAPALPTRAARTHLPCPASPARTLPCQRYQRIPALPCERPALERPRQPSVQESLLPQQLCKWAIWWDSPGGGASRARAGGAGAGGTRTRQQETLSSQQIRKRAVPWGSPGGGAWGATTGGTCESTPAGSAAGFRGNHTGGVEAHGGMEVSSLGAFDSANTGAEPEEALHTFTLDSGASRCFFRDNTTVMPVRTRRVTRPRPPPVPSTHTMALRASSVPQRVVLPSPPSSSLLHVHDPKFDHVRALSPYSSQWQTAMDAEMASWKSTSTYVDALPPLGANIVDGMWIFRCEGVDFFQTFSPTPKMTTLRVLLHVVAQRDYELHSIDFSTAFLQGSLHEAI
ncbi:unnamed protein product [Closterium sp. NIES-53]